MIQIYQFAAAKIIYDDLNKFGRPENRCNIFQVQLARLLPHINRKFISNTGYSSVAPIFVFIKFNHNHNVFKRNSFIVFFWIFFSKQSETYKKAKLMLLSIYYQKNNNFFPQIHNLIESCRIGNQSFYNFSDRYVFLMRLHNS